MFKMSAFSVDTGRQTTPSLVEWRGSQQTGPVHTTRRSDTRAVRRRPWLCSGTHAAA